MLTKEMIELVRQHHPHMGESEIVKLLNRAKNDFCARTEIVKDSYVFDTVVNQRYYNMDEKIIKVKSVWLNGIRIDKVVGKPIIDDEDSGEYT